jgi:hypothetical protein
VNIWIPHQRLEPPNGYCSICDMDLWGSVGDLQAPMAACVRANIDEIRAQAPSVKHKGGPFDPENWNPDAEAHLKKVGERMLKEGRLEMLPNERIHNE